MSTLENTNILYDNFEGNALGHGEEYYEPIKGLSPCRKDTASHFSDWTRMDTDVMSIMDNLYSNDVKVDALQDDRRVKRDLDVLMDLYSVDVKVDRSRGCSMVESQIRDLRKTDKVVDGVLQTGGTDDFVDTLTPKIILQMEVQSRENLRKYDTIGVVNLLRTDMFVDGAKAKQEMAAIFPLLEVDMMVDHSTKSKEYMSGMQSAKPLHLMDGAIDGCFKSLLETDEQMDGGTRQSGPGLVDPYSHQVQGQDLIGSLFDVADLLCTDVEVDRQSYSERRARSSQVAKEREGYEEGEDLIVGIFGNLPKEPPSSDPNFVEDRVSGSPANASEKIVVEKPQKRGSFLGLFGLSNIPSMFKK